MLISENFSNSTAYDWEGHRKFQATCEIVAPTGYFASSIFSLFSKTEPIGEGLSALLDPMGLLSNSIDCMYGVRTLDLCQKDIKILREGDPPLLKNLYDSTKKAAFLKTVRAVLSVAAFVFGALFEILGSPVFALSALFLAIFSEVFGRWEEAYIGGLPIKPIQYFSSKEVQILIPKTV